MIVFACHDNDTICVIC